MPPQHGDKTRWCGIEDSRGVKRAIGLLATAAGIPDRRRGRRAGKRSARHRAGVNVGDVRPHRARSRTGVRKMVVSAASRDRPRPCAAPTRAAPRENRRVPVARATIEPKTRTTPLILGPHAGTSRQARWRRPALRLGLSSSIGMACLLATFACAATTRRARWLSAPSSPGPVDHGHRSVVAARCLDFDDTGVATIAVGEERWSQAAGMHHIACHGSFFTSRRLCDAPFWHA